MDSKIFNSLEIDAIGEILNISLGASATAVSTMLSKRVDITTPTVRVLSFDEFEFGNLEPAVGVEITYVSGLSGTNIMLLKRHDVKVIVEMLMGTEIPDEEFELDEMNVSAICEVMNQMMGASSTALSEFLDELVNISTPISFEIDDVVAFKRKYFQTDDPMVVISFKLKIEDVMESEFLSVMSISLAKRLVSAFGLNPETQEESIDYGLPQESVASTAASGGMMSQDEINAMLGQVSTPTPPPANKDASSGSKMTQEEIEAMLGMTSPATPPSQPQPQQQMQYQPQPQQQMQYQPQPQQQMQQQMQYQPQPQQQMQYQQMPQYQVPPQQYYEPKVINVQPMNPPSLNMAVQTLGEEQAENLALIMEVPLEVSVEIGRTKKLVKDILELTSGSLVVLDKLAGEQVDLFVNGQCIAKGDVVVVDDNFGVRITEIIKKPEVRLEGVRN